MSNREFLMLAKTLQDQDQIGSMFMSTKLDGQRCLWDGGVSRGLPKAAIPWANHNKDERYQIQPIATGLWTRYGNVIHAPDWFLNQLPLRILMDGELYLGRGQFQETRTIVSRLFPMDGWQKVSFNVFDLPSYSMFIDSGKINNPNFEKHIVKDECAKFFENMPRQVLTFDRSVRQLYGLYDNCRGQTVWKPLSQEQLPCNQERAKEKLLAALEEETKLNGEGMMLRSPGSIWHPKRSNDLLKVKKLSDDEGTIIGWTSGLGKLSGKFGALLIEWKGKQFELSGFTDDERMVWNNDWAAQNPGFVCTERLKMVHFKEGEQIRFTYRGLTDSGLPREARYFR